MLGEDPTQPGSHPVPEVHQFTPRKQSMFLLELTKTGTIRGAAGRVGVSSATVYRYAQKSEAFRNDIERARDEWEQAMVERVAEAGGVRSVVERKTSAIGKKYEVERIEPGDWRANAWLLEHSPATRDRYAGVLKSKVEIGGSDDLPPIQVAEQVAVEIGPDTMERLTKVIMVLAAAGKLRLPDPGEMNGEVKDVSPDDPS